MCGVVPSVDGGIWCGSSGILYYPFPADAVRAAAPVPSARSSDLLLELWDGFPIRPSGAGRIGNPSHELEVVCTRTSEGNHVTDYCRRRHPDYPGGAEVS